MLVTYREVMFIMQLAVLKNSDSFMRTLAVALCAISLLMFSSCGGGSTPETAQMNTPTGNAPPRTSQPMPPVARSSNSAFPTSTPSSSLPTAPSHGADIQFGWTLLDNRHMSLSDYQGKVVVLDFYATWCPPCRESIPHLVDLQHRYGSKGLQVIGLNVGGPDDRFAIPQFVQQYRIQYTLGFPDDQMTNVMMSDDDSIPQAFVFDQKGHLVKRFIGYSDDVPQEMEQIIQHTLAE